MQTATQPNPTQPVNPSGPFQHHPAAHPVITPCCVCRRGGGGGLEGMPSESVPTPLTSPVMLSPVREKQLLDQTDILYMKNVMLKFIEALVR
jgi:hypothetical protein